LLVLSIGVSAVNIARDNELKALFPSEPSTESCSRYSLKVRPEVFNESLNLLKFKFPVKGFTESPIVYFNSLAYLLAKTKS